MFEELLLFIKKKNNSKIRIKNNYYFTLKIVHRVLLIMSILVTTILPSS